MEDRRWIDIHIDNVQEKFNLPIITKAEFSQLYEVTSSVHSLLKGKSVISQIRNAEVNREEVGNFEDLRELLEDAGQTHTEWLPLRARLEVALVQKLTEFAGVPFYLRTLASQTLLPGTSFLTSWLLP